MVLCGDSSDSASLAVVVFVFRVILYSSNVWPTFMLHVLSQDIYENPQFHDANETRIRFREGDRGQSWMVSACCALYNDPDIWNKVVCKQV